MMKSTQRRRIAIEKNCKKCFFKLVKNEQTKVDKNRKVLWCHIAINDANVMLMTQIDVVIKLLNAKRMM